ncbi:hypothetical protein ACIO13_20660 [Streptomyces sp. NPDC087425]|uniref:hypothetical protein n=1 Tax=Streptomyces sp. NPDC087425 TaxID=3365787 RepID=UPI0038095D6E
MEINSLDGITSSIKDGEPVMLVHKLSGGYGRRDGDLQVVNLTVAQTTDRSDYFRMRLAGRHRGNNLYTFESLQVDAQGNRIDPKPVVMSANPVNVGDGIQWAVAQKLSDDSCSNVVRAQYWYVLPQPTGGYAILSYLNPVFALGLYTKSVILPVCGRPDETVYGVIPDMCRWEIIAPNSCKGCIENQRTTAA